MDLELFSIEEHRSLAAGVHLIDLPFVAAADIRRAVGRADHRPEKRRGRFVDELRRRTENELAVDVDREVFDVTLEKGRLVFHRSGGKQDAPNGQSIANRQDCLQKRFLEVGPQTPDFPR